MNVAETVVTLLSEILTRDPMDLPASMTLDAEYDVSPIDVARLAIACEKAFGIALYDEKVAQWHTLNDVCQHLEGLMEAGLAKKPIVTEAERTAWHYE